MINKMLKRIKKFIPNKIKAEILAFIQPVYSEKYGHYKSRKKFFVFLSGYYRNLGDMAITYAQECFLKDNFPGYEVIMIPSTKTYALMKTMKRICNREDIITILGGGNMDDIYTSLEDARQFVIRNFPHNRIVSFPQTISFSDTPYGRKRFSKTIRVYNRHKNLHIFTREEKSLKTMKEHFKNARVELCPDIVLYLTKMHPQFERKGILCCLRDDKEKSIPLNQKQLLSEMLKKDYDDVLFTDTVNITMEECLPENTPKTLNVFWDLLKSKKVVITDRLHCMIFCVITGTPCIVLDNSNRKISGVHKKWLKEYKYIKMLEEFDLKKIKEYIEQLLKTDISDITQGNFHPDFIPLFKACKPEIKENK